MPGSMEREAQQRAAMQYGHQQELETERMKHESLVAKLRAENEANLKRLAAQQENSLQVDRQQQENLRNAMLSAQQRRTELEGINRERLEAYRESECGHVPYGHISAFMMVAGNAQAALAALRRQNSLLMRENESLRVVRNCLRFAFPSNS